MHKPYERIKVEDIVICAVHVSVDGGGYQSGLPLTIRCMLIGYVRKLGTPRNTDLPRSRTSLVIAVYALTFAGRNPTLPPIASYTTSIDLLGSWLWFTGTVL